MTDQLFIQAARDPSSADFASCDLIVGEHRLADLEVGSLWLNSVTGDLFACVNPADGTWAQVSLRHHMPSVQAADAAVAPTAAQSGSRFICSNAAATTVTLPTIAERLVYEFLRAADEEFVIASAEGGNMVVGNDLEANSITFTTAGQQIGALVRVEGVLVGADLKWLVSIAHVPFGTGVTGGFTYAIAT